MDEDGTRGMEVEATMVKYSKISYQMSQIEELVDLACQLEEDIVLKGTSLPIHFIPLFTCALLVSERHWDNLCNEWKMESIQNLITSLSLGKVPCALSNVMGGPLSPTISFNLNISEDEGIISVHYNIISRQIPPVPIDLMGVLGKIPVSSGFGRCRGRKPHISLAKDWAREELASERQSTIDHALREFVIAPD